MRVVLAAVSLEFSRDYEWTDWKGMVYSLKGEWQYVNGEAIPQEGCAAGYRDRNNRGKKPIHFLEEVNAFIKKRRLQGHGQNLEERDALLTIKEVLALRLYTGPAYQPINTFLRAVASLSSDYRHELADHPNLTFSATCRLIATAIRKLAAVATKEESSGTLYRGVRGELPRSFWVADSTGFICATDMAFMSTSRNRATPIAYMAGEGMPNVLWCLKTMPESNRGFHYGADVSMLSQYGEEEEVLFPPCTLMRVMKAAPNMKRLEKSESVEHSTLETSDRFGKFCSEQGRSFLSVDVLPEFI